MAETCQGVERDIDHFPNAENSSELDLINERIDSTWFCSSRCHQEVLPHGGCHDLWVYQVRTITQRLHGHIFEDEAFAPMISVFVWAMSRI